jgi:hydroxymethylglutaryl-CoA lyase
MTGNPADLMPTRLRVVEVGMRDGLQAVPEPLPTEAKVGVISGLIEAGVREIEAVSFAHPAVLPQLADAEAVMQSVPRPDGVRYRGLVPNLRGARRASACGLDEVVALTCCDERVSQINQGRGVEEVLRELPEIAEVTAAAGADLVVGIAMAFFATGSGLTDPSVPLAIAARAVDAGATGVYFADTAGMADPVQVSSLIGRARELFGETALGVHLHTRNGLAMANTYAAIQAGIDWVESAFCGLGGDLWFPGDPAVLGNTPTEDVVALTDAIGIETGIDLKRYLRLVADTAALVGRDPISYVTRGGTREELAGVDWDDVMAAGTQQTTARPRAR